MNEHSHGVDTSDDQPLLDELTQQVGKLIDRVHELSEDLVRQSERFKEELRRVREDFERVERKRKLEV